MKTSYRKHVRVNSSSRLAWASTRDLGRALSAAWERKRKLHRAGTKKKWFQVTLQTACSPAGMRDQNVARSVVETVPLCSPPPPLGGNGSVLQSQSAFLPARSHRLGTAFRSPAATVLFRRPPQRGQCSWPIPSTGFRSLPPARSAFSSHPRLRSSRFRGCSLLEPVAGFQARNSQTSVQLSLPFRTFILPDRSALSAAELEKLTLVTGPIPLRSPNASIIIHN